MLSDQDIVQLRDAVAAGKPATVWFTAKAVGVEAGKSGKVLSFAEPAEGDFIEVKPTGSQDALSFSQAELTLTKPKPRRQPAATRTTTTPAATPTPAPAAKPAPAAVAPAPEEIYKPAAAADKADKPARKPSSRRQPAKPPAEVTVTLHSTPRGDWTVEVSVGKKRSLRPTPIQASAIAKISKELPNQVEDAIRAVMAAARQQHQERIELLQAELEAARRALGELS